MKISFPIEHVQKNLSLLNRAVSSKSQLPILLNFYIEAKEGILTLRATDLEIGVETKIPVAMEEEGKVTVPAKIFTELISSLPSDKVVLQTDGDTLEVISNKTRSSFNTSPAEEYPDLYNEEGEKFIVLTPNEVLKKLTRIIFAASIDTQRPALSGIYIKKEKDGVLMVATDGYRLSLEKLEKKEEIDEENGEDEKPLLVPARVLREMIQFKSDKDIFLSVSKKNNQILFLHDSTALVGRLIDAQYPQFEKIIPSGFGSRVEFDTEEMHKAVKICSFFAKDAANIVRLSLTKDGIVVSANTPSVGKNIVEVEGHLTGEENQIAFNVRYLLELLQNVSDKEMIFEMNGPLSPGVFKLKEDPSFLHIIMPVRVQTEE